MTTMKLSTKDITQMGMFTALTAIGAFVSIPVGPVSITLIGNYFRFKKSYVFSDSIFIVRVDGSSYFF